MPQHGPWKRSDPTPIIFSTGSFANDFLMQWNPPQWTLESKTKGMGLAAGGTVSDDLSPRDQVVVVVTRGISELGLLPRDQFSYVYVTDDLHVTADRKLTLRGPTSGVRRMRALPKPVQDLSWLRGTEGEKTASPETLRSLYKFVQQSLREGDFSIVDALFRAVEVTALPAEALVAMLRY